MQHYVRSGEHSQGSQLTSAREIQFGICDSDWKLRSQPLLCALEVKLLFSSIHDAFLMDTMCVLYVLGFVGFMNQTYCNNLYELFFIFFKTM